MMKYSVVVRETLVVTKLYTVEAADRQEAIEHASVGDTVNEEELRIKGVIGREVEEGSLTRISV